MADESIPQPESRPARERHEWTDPEDEIMYTVTIADGWMSGMGAKPSRDLRIVQAPLVREILRLAAENAEQRHRIASLESGEVRLMDDALAVAAERDRLAEEAERLRDRAEALAAENEALRDRTEAFLAEMMPDGVPVGKGMIRSRLREILRIATAGLDRIVPGEG